MKKRRRNGLVRAMTIRHAGKTRMKDRREKRSNNPKRKKEEY